MTDSERMQLIKEFREAIRALKDADFEVSNWAHRARAKFPAADDGDRKFVDWCKFELGQLDVSGDELLARARTIGVVGDRATYRKVGGSGAIVAVLHMSKKEQIACIEAAKVEGKTVAAIVRARTKKVTPPRVDYRREAERLARYIRYAVKTPPDPIRQSIEMLLEHDAAPAAASGPKTKHATA